MDRKVVERVINVGPGTIGRLALDLMGQGLDDERILNRIHAAFPTCCTGQKSMNYYRKMVRAAERMGIRPKPRTA